MTGERGIRQSHKIPRAIHNISKQNNPTQLGELAGGRNVDKGTQFLCAILSLGPLGVAASISSFSGPSAGGRESIALAAKQPPLVHALSHHTALRARPFTPIHFHTLGLARCLDEHLCCRLEMLRPRVHTLNVRFPLLLLRTGRAEGREHGAQGGARQLWKLRDIRHGSRRG